MALLSKEKFTKVMEQARELSDSESRVLKGLLGQSEISDAELAADLSLLPSSIESSIRHLSDLNLVETSPEGDAQPQSMRVSLNAYGVEIASLLRSLEKF